MPFRTPALIKTLSFVTFLSLASTFAPKPAFALDRNVKSVFITSAYGLAVGTLVGLITLPLTQDARAVFIGSSVGLYLGIVIGIYHVVNRNDPQNPLYVDPAKTRSELEIRPGYVPMPVGFYTSLQTGPQSGFASSRPVFQLSAPVFRF